jgi:hypothetical protein
VRRHWGLCSTGAVRATRQSQRAPGTTSDCGSVQVLAVAASVMLSAAVLVGTYDVRAW